MTQDPSKLEEFSPPMSEEPSRVRDAGASASTSDPQKRKQQTQDSSYQNYLFGGAGRGDTPAWSDSAKGRFAIRMISRGVVGATFFVIGGRMASKQLDGYHPEHWKWDASKPLQAIAKGFDVTLGKGIEKTVTTFAGLKYGFGTTAAKAAGKQAVTFRNSRNFEYMVDGVMHSTKGRSYGADVVGFTFDFAMASTGDALTRNVIQAIDPNIKQTWKLNDKGETAKRGENWHFAPVEFAKWAGNTGWRIFSKNQGEDWAAAIPYAFQMKFQRQFLSNAFNKRWDGHQLVFDQSWNGGAYRVNQMGQKIADQQLPGAIDLHARFVGYNWYTLMFREGYDAFGRAFDKWKQNGFHMDSMVPENKNPITATIDGVGHAARYVTKSFIKANMYMNPAVIPFWMVRVPQSKWRSGHHIEEVGGVMKRSAHPVEGNPFSASNYEHFRNNTTFDKFEKGFSRALNPIGVGCNYVGNKAANLSDHMTNSGMWPKAEWLRKITTEKQSVKNPLSQAALDRNGRRKFMHEIVDASASYTPYMWAKAETGLRVDDTRNDGKLGQMDIAIYKFMDDVASFKFTQVPADLKKMWKLGTNFEREVKAREGATPDMQEMVRTTPENTVQAQTIMRGPAANEPTMHDERRWAQSVVGSDIHPSRIHSGSVTRH